MTYEEALKELKHEIDMLPNDKKFISAYNVWVESNYEYYKKPSVDRINPDKPYIFENMQFMTWEENRKKGQKERSRITTSVSMFDLSGNHIKDFESIKQAVNETGLNQSGITSCCCGRYRYTGGYVFRYKKVDMQKQMKLSATYTIIRNYWKENKNV